jgi:hypothetical protein
MRRREKNRPEPAQKRARPVGPFGPTQPTFVVVRVPFCSVLSRCNPNHVCKPPFARNVVESLRAAKKTRSTTQETLGGGYSGKIIAKPKGGHHEEGGRRELARASPELKDNEDPSSSEASTISFVPCLVS